MKCYRCQAENSEGARHCNSCGAALVAESNDELLGVGCSTLLLIIFVPVGVCGVLVVTGNPSDPYGFKQVAYFCIALAAFLLYLAGRRLSKK